MARSPIDISQSPEGKNRVGSQTCSPNRQRSPADRKMMRLIEKENSPIRAFLNAKQHGDDEAFAIRELDIDQIESGKGVRDFGAY